MTFDSEYAWMDDVKNEYINRTIFGSEYSVIAQLDLMKEYEIDAEEFEECIA